MSIYLRIIACVLALVMLVGGTLPVLPNEDTADILTGLFQRTAVPLANGDASGADTTSTSQAPDNYVPMNIYLDKKAQVVKLANEAETKKVLLIEDVLPWDSVANQEVLGSLTEYDKVTTSEFLDVELENYSVVVFANDQPFATYENYAAFKEYLEIFASIGGVIVFGACDAGWSNGNLIEALPGGVTKTNHNEYRNYIEDANHPIVTGELTDGQVLVNEELYSNYCSHISFDEDSFPAGTKVILRDTTEDRPTMIEYPLGQGRVIASGLTWEHNYTHGSSYGYRDFARVAMDDMFRYAIRISSIDVDELHLLTQWRMEKNAHTIIAADTANGMDELLPIAGAAVTVDHAGFVTNENGAVSCYDYGVRTVQIAAGGFRMRKVMYALNKRESRIFFMEKDKQDGLPYVVQATAVTVKKDRYFDLRDEVSNFTQDEEKSITLYLDGFWDTHGAGKFILYQEGTASSQGVYFEVRSGDTATFAPGKIFKPNRQINLKMVAADGTESEPIKLNINIDKKATDQSGATENELQEGLVNFDWIGNHTVKSDNEIFTKLLTADMSIKSDLSPLEISVSHNQDGTVTWKGVLGLVSGKMTKDMLEGKKSDDNGWDVPIKDAWNEWKKQINGYKTAGNPKAYIKNLKEEYGKDWKSTKLKVAHEVECNVAGYFEIVLDQDRNVVHSEGGILVEASGKFSIGQTFFAGPVPLYYEFKPGIEISVSGGIEFYDNGGWMFRPTFKGLELALPSISLEGGVGVRGVATAGIEGTGKMIFGFGGDNATSGKLEFGGAIHVKVLFVVDYKWNFWNTTIPLWPKEGAKKMAFVMGVSDPENGIEMNSGLANRDYLQNQTEWFGDVGGISQFRSGGASLQTLQYGVMPDALPAIHQVGDKIVMLMLQDNGEESLGNHTKLVYSVMENGYWTTPMPVMESDSADMFFDSQVIDGQLYVAWQKIKTQVQSEDPDQLLQAVAANAEICVAKWDAANGCFTEHQYLTENGTLDMMPSVAGNAEGVYVSWVNNDANNALGQAGKYTLYRVQLDGNPNTMAKKLEETNAYVTEFATTIINGQVHYAYTVMDNAYGTALYYNNGKKTVKLNTSADPAGLSFEGGKLLWQEDGTIYAYNTVDNKTSTWVQEQATSSYQYLSNGTNQAIVWLTAGDGGTQVMASVFNDGAWSDPITVLTGIEETVTYYDVLMTDDGGFSVIMNTLRTDEDGNEYTALQYAQIPPKTDVALQLVSPQYPNWENGTQEIRVMLENLGATHLTEAELCIYDAGTQLMQQTLEVDLKPGEMKSYTVELNIAELGNVKNARVEATVANDDTRENNTQFVELLPVDVSLAVDVYEQNEQMIFVFQIANASTVDANVALQISEDSLNGIVVDVKNVGVITNVDSVQYLYAVDKEKIDFGENGRKTYFFQIASLEEDWNEYDNTCFCTITKSPDEETDPDAEMKEYVVVDPEKVTILNGDVVFEALDAPSVQLTTEITPNNASVTYVYWEVEDADIVHITSGGLLTPLRAGSTKITAHVVDGVTHSITVTVKDPSVVDTTQLEKAIAAAKKIDRNLYTEESYKALQDALSNARKVLKNENATQEEVDQAVQMLNDAMAALKPVVSLWKWLLIGGIALVVIGGATTAIVLIRRKKKKNNET